MNATPSAPLDLSILPMGTAVRLPDGTEALAYIDRRNGTYVTAQILNGVERRDHGWRREQLTPIPEVR